MQLSYQKYKLPDAWNECSTEVGKRQVINISGLAEAFLYIENYCKNLPFFNNYEIHSIMKGKADMRNRIIIYVNGGDPDRKLTGTPLYSWMNKEPLPPMLMAEFQIYDDKDKHPYALGKFNVFKNNGNI